MKDIDPRPHIRAHEQPRDKKGRFRPWTPFVINILIPAIIGLILGLTIGYLMWRGYVFAMEAGVL